jgi:toxin ParE1/3/4
MKDFGFHPEASLEFTDAIGHYNLISPRLAESFIGEIEHAIFCIRRNPDRWRIIKKDVRRYLVHRFPYGVYYNYDDVSVTIWAVMHLSRKPNYWTKRKE